MSETSGSRAALRKRWDSEWRAVRDKFAFNLFFRLPLFRGLQDHPRHEGRIDLRGLSFHGPKTCKRTKFDLVDLSYADLTSWRFEDCQFSDVLLVQAKLSGARDDANEWKHVDFSSADLAKSFIGIRHSKYQNCNFRSTDLAKAIFSSPVFTECVFEDCRNLDGNDFNASAFFRCRFSGVLEDVMFRNGFLYPDDRKRYGPPVNNAMDHVDWSRLEIKSVGFAGGVKLDTVHLPGNQPLVRTYNLPALLAQLEHKLGQNTELSKTEQQELLDTMKVLAVYAKTGQQHYILDFSDCADALGAESARKIYDFIRSVENTAV